MRRGVIFLDFNLLCFLRAISIRFNVFIINYNCFACLLYDGYAVCYAGFFEFRVESQTCQSEIY